MLRGLRSEIKRAVFLSVAPIFLYIVLIFVIPLPGKLKAPEYGRIVRYRDGRIMRMYLSSDDKWRFYVPIEGVSQNLINATLSYEDRFFYYHLGVNPVAIFRAAVENLKHGKIVQGGSTITMQLARILEPKKRTIVSKIIEAFRANQLEFRLGKKKILEAYFNFAPYGGNVEGVKAASIFYLGKSPSSLSDYESAFLVSIPQSPTERMPLYSNRKKIKAATGNVLVAMYRSGLIDSQMLGALKKRQPVFYIRKPIIEAPHAADFVRLLYPDSLDIRSSIDRKVEQAVENITGSYREYINSKGAQHVSVVVIENSTRKIRALSGSFDYFDRNAGQVLGFYSLRSPGSALKPFLYTLAIQMGVITYRSLLIDAPSRFGRFSPSDFDQKYRGLVTAEDALSQSLNVPFVHLLRMTRYNNFLRLLEKAGVLSKSNNRYYGLPVITGGVEIRLIDLVNLYTTLARGGMHKKYTILEDAGVDSEFELLKPCAVFITLKALSMRARPDAPVLGNMLKQKYGPVYWKTGTSWGRRDALSIGFRKRYTVGVWAGNFDGHGSEKIVGAILASPLMFDILKAIDGGYFDGEFYWTDKALSNIVKYNVCAFSGYKPNKYCRKKEEVFVCKEQLPYRKCPYHRAYRVEKKTGFRACPYKHYKSGETVFKLFTVVPPQVMKIKGFKFTAPEFSPECKLVESSKGLVVVSPKNGAHYFFIKDVHFQQRVFLLAYTSSKDQTISWFVDDEFYGKSKSGESLEILPDIGKHTIFAQDADGRTQKIIIEVDK